MSTFSLACLLSAAAAYHVSVPAMQAIRTVEGGQVGQEVCGNYDGSCDLGPFQVNDHAWVNTLASALHAERQVVRATLRDDGCWNAQVASWILKQQLDQAGGDLQVAIGNYHSHWPREHFAYRQKVDMVLQAIGPGAPPPALPGTPEGGEPGAIRIPQDVTDPAATAAVPTPEPKGKLIRLSKHTADPVSSPPTQPSDGGGGAIESPGSDDASAPPAGTTPTPPSAEHTAAPAVRILRGNASAPE